jgi:hypothetical protein
MTHPIRVEINRLEAQMEGYQDSIKNLMKKIARMNKDLRENPDHEHQWVSKQWSNAGTVCEVCGVVKI